MLKSLLKIRISTIAWILFAVFIVVVLTIKQTKLTAGQLALFSVNTFLFGYYFAPLLSSQKSRVASLISAARQEEMVLLDILTQCHLLSKSERHRLKLRLRIYVTSVVGNTSIRADNPYYNELLYYVTSVHSKDEPIMHVIYDRISRTQMNRDTMNNLFESKIYSHEWLVALVLYAITLYFALQTNYNGSLFFAVMLAILCTGLTLLIVILIKFATLTHKEAKRMWTPLRDLLALHFDDISDEEVIVERQRIDDYVTASKHNHA
jgi:hypothetical protein